MTKVIAEIGQNYNGEIKLAENLIEEASAAGADYAKFQLFDVDAIFSKINNPWYEYNQKNQLTKDQYFRLVECGLKNGIEVFASPFDIERASWIKESGSKVVKIASRSIFDQELLEYCSSNFDTLICSLGFWDRNGYPNIEGGASVRFLYCKSEYPAIITRQELFESLSGERISGFSDHTVGVDASLAAISYGVDIIEKHFTLDKKMFGPDHLGSANVTDLHTICSFARYYD